MISKKWTLLAIVLIALMMVVGLLQTAHGAKASKPVLLAKVLRISPRLKELFPREQVVLCAISDSLRVNTTKLVWKHRVRKDSSLTTSAKTPANCRMYTAPTTVGWDRVTVTFNNKHFKASAAMIIPIVTAPPTR